MPSDVRFRTRLRSVLIAGTILLAGAVLTTTLSARPEESLLAGGPGGPAPSPQPIPADLFKGWPADRKPELAIILTGQQHGYLKFCGCSSPQLGGFERRYNFIAKLRERGWPLVAFDLGDLVTRQHRGLDAQTLLKYETAMNSLEAIGYAAIGVGENEFKLPLMEGLARFTLQKPDAFPRVLSANLADRMNLFPLNGQRSMVGDWVTTAGTGGVPRVGAVSVVGRSVADAVIAFNQAYAFEDNAKVLTAAIDEFDKQKVDLRVLLYHGDIHQAKLIAGDPKLLANLPAPTKAKLKIFPDKFDVILCLSAEEQPPARPDMVGKTMIVRIGHRGLHVGVVGAFKTGNAQKPFEMHYQYAQMGEEYETDKAKEADHPILKILDNYALEVKNQNFLGLTPQDPHPTKQVLPQANVRYAGSEACAGCHQAENKIWTTTKHSHAYEALTKKAEKPRLRQFDPECVVCHTVGFGYQTGFKSAGKRRRGYCTSDARIATARPVITLPTRRTQRTTRSLARGKHIRPTCCRRRTPSPRAWTRCRPRKNKSSSAWTTCVRKCHDIDNDPHFKFEKYWPVVVHGKAGFPRVKKVQR